MPSAQAMLRRDASAVERLAVQVATTLQAAMIADAAGDEDRTRGLLLDLIDDLTQLRGETDAAIDRAVGQCRRRKVSWSDIGEALGVSRQAAQARFHGPRLTAPGEFPIRTRELRRNPRGAQK